MGEGEDRIRQAFRLQAQYCADLGSPLTARLCKLFADRLDRKTAVGDFVFSWPGDATASGDSVPLRLCGAINHLAITGRNEALRANYPPNSDPTKLDDNAFWALIHDALERHGEAIIAFLANAPQTNEVRRSVALIPAYHVISKHFGLPLAIRELGASAGLNLHAHLYGLKTAKQYIGAKHAPLVLEPEWRGQEPATSEVAIDSVAGCDLAPMDVTKDEIALRQLAYIWPDQFERVKLIRLAIEFSGQTGIVPQKADAIDWLEQELKTQEQSRVLTVQHTIAWQYFPEAAKQRGEALLSEYGSKATHDKPMARISMENDGELNGARIQLTVWPDGAVHELGRVDFHGRWVDWKNSVL